ncbi:hypothetical protein SAMN06273572_11086 [Monaibacterium marinum]|uniref:YhhN-like protein n=1 Tax=Pontivivens marinum TaxID=1690039 RepID=A0A2C9CV98_9RHOB|nr:hypothetical protein [Monaibacterium marinum]SOH95411.1 hypothetical protein SAMN06273572_11086 [Monaibacterium marinum]
MIFQGILVAISAVAATLYLVLYRKAPPSRRRALVKATAAGSLMVATIIEGAPITLVFYFASAALCDAILAREDGDDFFVALAVALMAQIFLCLTFLTAWTGIDAPFVAAIGLGGIWVGYFMLIWGGLVRSRVAIICYSVGMLASTYVALGTDTYGQFAVIGMLFYVLSQVLISLEIYMLRRNEIEAVLAGHSVWISYYTSLLMFFVAFCG